MNEMWRIVAIKNGKTRQWILEENKVFPHIWNIKDCGWELISCDLIG